MGVIGTALNDIVGGVKNLVLFFVIFAVVCFVAGMWFAVYYSGTNTFWYPMYLLILLLVAKVASDMIHK